jgi:hypothetical protein
MKKIIVLLVIIILSSISLFIFSKSKDENYSYGEKAVAKDNTIFMIDKSGNIYHWDSMFPNITPQKIENDKLTNITSISIGNINNYAVNSFGKVLYWKKENKEEMIRPILVNEMNLKNVQKVRTLIGKIIVLSNSSLILYDEYSMQKVMVYNDPNILDFEISIAGSIGDLIIKMKDNSLWMLSEFLYCNKPEEINAIKLEDDIKQIDCTNDYVMALDNQNLLHIWLPGWQFGSANVPDISINVIDTTFENAKEIFYPFLISETGELYKFKYYDNDQIGFDLVYNEEKVVYINNYIFVTDSGNVFYLEMKEFEKYNPRFVMNIYNERNNITENPNSVSEPSSVADPSVDSPNKANTLWKFDEKTKTDMEENISYDVNCVSIKGYQTTSSYNTATAYNEGLAAVAIPSDEERDPMILTGNYKWGYIDTKGNVVVPFDYDSAKPFSEGLALVKKDGEFLYIDTKGDVKIVLDSTTVDAGNFHCGKAWVWKGNKVGYINNNGEIVIPCQFIEAFDFSEGLAGIISDNGQFGFINELGQVTIEPQFDWLDSDSYVSIIQSKGLVFKDNIVQVSKNLRYGYIDKYSKETIPFIYSFLGSFNDGFARFARGQSEYGSQSEGIHGNHSIYGYIDKNGNELLLGVDGSDFSLGYAIVKYENTWYTIDNLGNVMNTNIDNDIQWIDGTTSYGLYLARTNSDKFGFIDAKGQFIIPAIYDSGKDVAYYGEQNVILIKSGDRIDIYTVQRRNN